MPPTCRTSARTTTTNSSCGPAYPVADRARVEFLVDPQADDFGWSLAGNSLLDRGHGVVQEGSQHLGQIRQLFALPSGSGRLQFQIAGANLSNRPGMPPDAFEVSLRNAADGTPLLGTLNELAGGDAFLNIQPNGQVYFTAGVGISQIANSGDIWDFQEPLDVIIDLGEVPGGTLAALSFDLIGFAPGQVRDLAGNLNASAVFASFLRFTVACPWNNPRDRYDANFDGFSTPQDALVIINELNRLAIIGQFGRLPSPLTPQPMPPFFYDVNCDNFGTPQDALVVINELHRRAVGEPEGEGRSKGSVLHQPWSGILPLVIDIPGPTRAAGAQPAQLPDRQASPGIVEPWDEAFYDLIWLADDTLQNEEDGQDLNLDWDLDSRRHQANDLEEIIQLLLGRHCQSG